MSPPLHLTNLPDADIAALAIACGVTRSVAIQVQRLLTYPMVRTRVDEGRLSLHGWHYIIEEGTIVMIVCDGGWKYLSAGVWTDDIDVVEARAKATIYF